MSQSRVGRVWCKLLLCIRRVLRGGVKSQPGEGRVWQLTPAETEDPLAALAAHLQKAGLTEGWCLLQRTVDIRLLSLDADLARLSERVVAYPHGRIFTPDWELRWATEGDDLSWLALGEAEPPPLPEGWQVQPAPYTWKLGALMEIRLWGEYRPKAGFFSVPRIPRPLDYPLPKGVKPQSGDEVVLQARWYRRNGIIEFTRYCGLELAPRTGEGGREAGGEGHGQSV